MLGNWPSFDPNNFRQFKPNDPSNPSGIMLKTSVLTFLLMLVAYSYQKITPITYHPTHDRTLPPPDQVIGQEVKNILLRHIYQHAEEKMTSKREARDAPTPERASKVPRPDASL